MPAPGLPISQDIRMNKYSTNVWLWKDPEKSGLRKVLNYISASVPLDKDIILLSCEDVTGFEKCIPITNYFFTLSMKFNFFEGDQMMFLNLKDVISSMELHLRRLKKDGIPENDALEEVVCKFFNKYVNSFETDKEDDESVILFKSFLKQNNCLDVRLLLEQFQKHDKSEVCNHISGYRYLILGKPCSVFKKLIGILNEKICCISLETPLDISLHGSPRCEISEKIQVDGEYLELKEIAVNADFESKLGSATEEYVEDLFLSFLSLLINSRNELALSKALISPVINLNHEAFTALKHLATDKEMPMCQVAVSYVTRIRLGGKGYAPAADCPMLPHLNNLEVFVDTLNQMHTLIEEESCPSTAIRKLINTLKKKLLKCGREKLNESSVEAVTENLQSTYLAISDILKNRISSNSTLICQETLDILYHFINFINGRSFADNPELVFANKYIKRTPLNLPPLLGYFRSPEEESSCDTKSSVNEDSLLSKSSQAHHPAFPSYFHQSDSSEVSSCINSSTPSKLTFNGCLGNKGEKLQKWNYRKAPETDTQNSQDAPANKKRRRSILGDITNETNTARGGKILEKSATENAVERSRSTKTKQNKKEAKGCAKKFKQIQGQGKITNFFLLGAGS